MTVVSSIDVLKDNVDADMGRKEQVTAYIEYALHIEERMYAPEYFGKRKEKR